MLILKKKLVKRPLYKFFIVFVVFFACTKNSEEEIVASQPTIDNNNNNNDIPNETDFDSDTLVGDTIITEPPLPIILKSFRNDVEPILKNRCISCHQSGNMKGGVDLSDYSKVGQVVSPSNSGGSPLYGSVAQIFGSSMPPNGGKLSSGDIETIKIWIDEGALDN
jgi:hypothetical protein